ncbi:MAG: BON domain-containing protein [Burkholderiales bacterium]|jgi:osmotically-inducible protein OsmY|nr:BON domain-containing protein [Burkholderiales bacterium]
MTRPSSAPLAFALVVLLAPLLNACAPVLVAGAVAGGALVATDRRSAGAQLDDQSIELKITTEMGTRHGDRLHLNVTSFNGVVLLTGEAADAAMREDVAKFARGTDRVRAVHDEMVVGPPSDLSARTNDSYITSKVKSRFVEANKFSATHVKVVTERSVVYLMGIVSKSEADAAAQIASTTSGVARVVKLFEITG